jgi:hypothetical protein
VDRLRNFLKTAKYNERKFVVKMNHTYFLRYLLTLNKRSSEDLSIVIEKTYQKNKLISTTVKVLDSTLYKIFLDLD